MLSDIETMFRQSQFERAEDLLFQTAATGFHSPLLIPDSASSLLKLERAHVWDQAKAGQKTGFPRVESQVIS